MTLIGFKYVYCMSNCEGKKIEYTLKNGDRSFKNVSKRKSIRDFDTFLLIWR